jgi:carboxypeptidase family protein
VCRQSEHVYGDRMQSTASSVAGTVEIPRPNIVVGQPSTLPVPGATVEALRENDVVAVATTDENGRYVLRLRPGTYLIRVKAAVQSKNPGETVTIFTGETRTVRFIVQTIPRIL